MGRLDLKRSPAPPVWRKRIAFLWQQDDAGGEVTRADSPKRAWKRLFGDDIDRVQWLYINDQGDHLYFVDIEGRVYIMSYPGNESIGRVRGPFACVPEEFPAKRTPIP